MAPLNRDQETELSWPDSNNSSLEESDLLSDLSPKNNLNIEMRMTELSDAITAYLK